MAALAVDEHRVLVVRAHHPRMGEAGDVQGRVSTHRLCPPSGLSRDENGMLVRAIGGEFTLHWPARRELIGAASDVSPAARGSKCFMF